MTEQPQLGASKAEVAAYVADLVGDLARMAKAHRLDILTYLLEVARLEAQNAAGKTGASGSQVS
jgi:hypothetical protein